MDYKHGRKNQWRRRSWREIAKRVENKKDARVLYLAGRQDLDRSVAIKKGFQPDNLFAVDNCPGVVEELRKRRCNAICGDVFDVAIAGRDFFNVLYLDLTGGVSLKLHVFFELLILSSVVDRVVLLNLLNGRDRYSNKFKEVYKDEVKCRAELAYGFLLKLFHECVVERVSTLRFQDQRYHDLMKEMLSPVVGVYKGKKSSFSTLVFTLPAIFEVDFQKEIKRGEAFKIVDKKFVRKLAAAKAVAKMRRSGKLPGSPRW